MKARLPAFRLRLRLHHCHGIKTEMTGVGMQTTIGGTGVMIVCVIHRMKTRELIVTTLVAFPNVVVIAAVAAPEVAVLDAVAALDDVVHGVDVVVATALVEGLGATVLIEGLGDASKAPGRTLCRQRMDAILFEMRARMPTRDNNNNGCTLIESQRR